MVEVLGNLSIVLGIPIGIAVMFAILIWADDKWS